MWTSSRERMQHLYLERDYLKVLDNILFNVEQINNRYHSNNHLLSYDRRPNRFSNNIRNPSRNYINSTTIPQTPSIFSTPQTSAFNIFSRQPALSTTINRTTNSTNTNNLDDNFENFINNTLYTPTRVDFPTYNQIIRSTSSVLFSDLSNNTCTTCTISRDEFEPNDIVLKINHCGHVFKKEFLLVWFESSSKCPSCRHDIRYPIGTPATPTRTTGNRTTIHPTRRATIHPTRRTTRRTTRQPNTISTLISNFNADLSNNILNAFNIPNNNNNIITQNISNAIDDITSSVLENFTGSLGQILNQPRDLSNNVTS